MALSRNSKQYLGVRAIMPPDLQRAERAPTSSDTAFLKGTLWLDDSGAEFYAHNGSGNWILLGSSGVPRSVSVTLTSDQVKNLTTIQKELVPAPGAGKVIQFLGAQLKLDYGGTNAFTESGDNLAIKYTDDSGVAVSDTIESTGFIDQTADTYTSAVAIKDAIVAATGAENQALVLDNLGSDIAGNAADDNTLVVSVVYTILEL